MDDFVDLESRQILHQLREHQVQLKESPQELPEPLPEASAPALSNEHETPNDEWESMKKSLEADLERAKRDIEDRLRHDLDFEGIKRRLEDSKVSRSENVAQKEVSIETDAQKSVESLYVSLKEKIKSELEAETRIILEKRDSVAQELESLREKIELVSLEKTESLKQEIAQAEGFQKVLDQDLEKIEELKIQHSAMAYFSL